MRDLVLAGTQRIRPAGAYRTHSSPAAIALILVGGVSGGAVTTAALIGNQPPGPISTPDRDRIDAFADPAHPDSHTDDTVRHGPRRRIRRRLWQHPHRR